MPASSHRGPVRIALIAVLGLVAGVLVSPAVAPVASATPATTIVDSPVDEVIDAAMSPAGVLYAVGGFTEAGPATGGLTRLDSSTAQVDRTFTTVNGQVTSMVVDGSGRTYLGGRFVSVAGQLRAGIARLNADGSLDMTWAPAVTGPYPVVNTLALSGTTLFIGGQFTGVAGAARQNLAAVDTVTGNALSWAPNPNSSVSALTTDDSSLYIGGAFTTPATRLASYSLADLTRRSGWSPAGADQTVESLVVDNGTLYAGGNFMHISDDTRNGLAALDTTTGNATSWNPNITLYGSVSEIIVDDTIAYVGGNFTTVNGGTVRNRAAALRTDDTGTATAWNPNLGPAGNVYAMALTDNHVYLGGTFEYVNGNPSDGFNRVSVTTGTVDGSWDPGMVTSNSGAVVNSLLVQGSSVIAGGNFTHMNVVERNGAASFDSQMRLTSWNPNINGTPYALLLSGTTAYVVGSFTAVNGSVGRDYAAAFRTDDTGTATAWDPEPDSYPYDMVIDGNTAYLVGDFGDVGGTTRNYAAAVRIDDAGTLTAWDPDLDSAAYSIALADGVAYMAGDFSSVNGGSINRYTAGAVSIEDTGTATAWDPDPDSNAYGVAVSNGIAYLVGGFGNVKNNSTPVTRNYAAAITTEGAGTVTDWDPDFGGSPYDVEISGDYAYIAGDFTDLNGGAAQRDGLAAVYLDDTGSASDTWIPLATGGFGYSQPYEGGLTVAGPRLLVGGNFPMANLDGVDYPGGLAALPIPASAPPVTPTPVSASAPREAQATPGDRKAGVAWKAPVQTGSFPITYYRATSTPGGHVCLVAAPALTCEVAGLTNGTPYTFTVAALTGAGWSTMSDPSNAVVPRATPDRAIVITGSRDGNRIVVEGSATGMGMGGELNPYVRFPGQSGFAKGSATILVSMDGTFEWSRKAGKRISVYVATPDGSMRSNTVTISAR